jgi:hypothetical protein
LSQIRTHMAMILNVPLLLTSEMEFAPKESGQNCEQNTDVMIEKDHTCRLALMDTYTVDDFVLNV